MRYGRSRYERDYGYGGFAPYVPVAQRRAKAAAHAAKLAKKEGRELLPVKIPGRNIATTYWGKAWCDNLTAYSDFANRLPRGRTYARNGSVIDLQIKQGKVEAIVSGSEIYTVTISIETLSKPSWNRVKSECSQSIASLIDLLQGRFDDAVMQRLAHPKEGLFPQPKEMEFDCSCPDYAGLCKHVAAVLYGVGNRLDSSPELLFTLRNVDHLELVSHATADANLDRSLAADGNAALSNSDLSEMFGIELAPSVPATKQGAGRKVGRKKQAAKAPLDATSELPAPKPATRRKTSTAKQLVPVKVAKKSASAKPARGKAR